MSKLSASSNQFRNKVVFYGTLPTIYGLNIGVRYSGIGGSRYSMIVAGNVNGDFVASNDLAYVFNPNNPTVDAAVKTGIQAILDNPLVSKGFKDYLNKSMDGVAERNGGINGFSGQWDIRVAKKFKTYKGQFVELSADVFNFANLLNKEWGVTEALGTQSIYSIGGFNAANNTYKYNVNPNAGIINPSGSPYQIQLGLRYGF
ncbi:MAG: hypothetical protein ABIP95_00770 [Pelobium sp.]